MLSQSLFQVGRRGVARVSAVRGIFGSKTQDSREDARRCRYRAQNSRYLASERMVVRTASRRWFYHHCSSAAMAALHFCEHRKSAESVNFACLQRPDACPCRYRTQSSRYLISELGIIRMASRKFHYHRCSTSDVVASHAYRECVAFSGPRPKTRGSTRVGADTERRAADT